MNTEKRTILWVDDQIEFLGSYCNILREEGFTLDIASSSVEALELVKTNSYDIFLIDLRMPGIDGVDLLRDLYSIDKNKKSLFGAFSSFLYLEKYKSRLLSLDFPVELIDKDFPPIDSPEMDDRFLFPIRELSKHGVQHSINELKNITKKTEGIDPFRISYSDFCRKTLPEKDALLDSASRIAKETILTEFDNGKIWVLLCGSSRIVRFSAKNASEIPREEEIIDYARKMGSAPYQIFKGSDVEDLNFACQGEYYPTVSLEFESFNSGESHTIDIHFDTGSPICFMSYEDLIEKGIIQPSSLVGVAYMRKGFSLRYRAIPLRENVIFECQRGMGTKSVTIHGQIVRDWLNSPYSRFCESEACPNFQKGGERMICPYRSGLIGRNFLSDNGLKLVIDPLERQTGFEEEGSQKC